MEETKVLPFDKAIDAAMESDNSRFPFDVFPIQIQALIQDADRTVNYPPEYLAAGILSCAATALGTSAELDTGSWIARPILWLAIIGRTGEHKTHPLTFAKKPFEDRDTQSYADFKAALEEYQALPPEDRKKRPKYSKFLLKDFTAEYLAESLKHNERGVLIYQDELMGWINSFDQYKKGGDQQKYLELWNGGTFDVGRKSSDPIRVEKTNVNILGGMQPEVLKEMAKNNRVYDGFLSRFLFAYPENLKPRLFTGESLPEIHKENYQAIISNLLAVEEAFVVAPEECVQTYKEWQHKAAKEYFHDYLEKAIQAKLETYVWRLALVLEMLSQAAIGQESETLRIESLEGAIRLIEYFRHNALKVHKTISSRSPLDSLPARQRSVYEELPETFKRKEVLPLFEQMKLPTRTGDALLSNDKLFYNSRTLKDLKQGDYKKKYN